MDRTLHPHTRQRRIQAVVRDEPGVQKSRLCVVLGLAWATMCRDVEALMDAGALVVHRTGRDSHLYLPEDAPRHPSLSLDHARSILQELEHQDASALMLAKSLRISQPIIQHRLDALEADGLVSSHGHAPRIYRSE